MFIKSLLLSFYFKVFPEIIQDGRLFISEPPLYRINDKKNPFVINKKDYLDRYIGNVLKSYQLAFATDDTPSFLTKSELREFLSVTNSYVEEIGLLADHYRINERLVELIIYELALSENKIDWNRLMPEIGLEFPEIYYDVKDSLIKGIIDGKYQSLEISDRFIRKAAPLTEIIKKYEFKTKGILLKDTKIGSIENHPMLLALKILSKYKAQILHRFKGLGENEPEELRPTVMDPNTRMLIRVNISSLEQDMEVFNILRGNSPEYALARKKLMKDFVIDKDMIDT